MNVAWRGTVHALAPSVENAVMVFKMTRCGEFIVPKADAHKVITDEYDAIGDWTNAEIDCMACIATGETI